MRNVLALVPLSLFLTLPACIGGPIDVGQTGNNVLAAHCYNKVVDGDETDIDCGGECMTCADGKVCAANKDCSGGQCKAGRCGKPCGGACNLANAVAACVNDACAINSCNAGFGDCDRNAANGCEVELAADNANCGACGQACGFAMVCERALCVLQNAGCDPRNCNPPNAVGKCVANACAIDSCNPGFADCNANAADGCEVDVANSAANCGACGVMCRGLAGCRAGVCL